MTRSDSPPAYDSALSKKLMPASYAVAMHARASATPICPLNDTHDPNDSTLTFRPARPNRRYSMVPHPRVGPRYPSPRGLLMDGHMWIAEFAAALGVEAPSAALIDELLALAGDAPHAS